MIHPRLALLLLALGLASGNLLADPPQGAATKENSAIIPMGKLEKDFYDWDQRHAAAMTVKDRIKPEIVMLGDSITHLWGGEPTEPKGGRGAQAWKDLFGERKVLNLGFGYDRTQNVLKRIELGELDGLDPKAVVVLIGTNNIPGTKNARANTPAEIAEAIGLIVEHIQGKCPHAKVIVMGIFPRGEKPNTPYRKEILEINTLIAPLGKRQGVEFLDIGAKFLQPEGAMGKEVMGDYLHPSAKGYAIWADALKGSLPK